MKLSVQRAHEKRTNINKKTNRWNRFLITDFLRQEPIAYLPGEDRGALALVVGDLAHDVTRCNARLAPADGPRFNRSRFIVATEYL